MVVVEVVVVVLIDWWSHVEQRVFACQFISAFSYKGIYSTNITIYVNIFTMAYISIDRYFAIIKPFKIQKTTNSMHLNSNSLNRAAKRKIYIALSVIWFIAFTLALPQFMFIKMSDDKRSDDDAEPNFAVGLTKRCVQDYPYENMTFYMVFINFSLQYLIPFLIISIFYGRIIYHLYLNLNLDDVMMANSGRSNLSTIVKNIEMFSCCGHKKASKTIGTSQMCTESDKRTHNLKKSMKLMVIIIALFLLSIGPIHLYRLITTFYPLLRSNSSLMQIKPTVFDPTNSTATTAAANCTIENFLHCFYLTTNSNQNGPIQPTKTLHNRYAYFFCHFLSMSSVCYNPIVYFWMHKKFRRDVKSLFANLTKIFRNKKYSLIMLLRSTRASKSASDAANGSCMICNDGSLLQVDSTSKHKKPKKIIYSNRIIEQFKIDASLLAYTARQSKMTSVWLVNIYFAQQSIFCTVKYFATYIRSQCYLRPV